MEYNNLTPEEERVILRKGTEMPYTNEYNNFFEVEHTFAKDVILPCINQVINFTQDVAGLPLMMPLKVQ